MPVLGGPSDGQEVEHRRTLGLGGPQLNRQMGDLSRDLCPNQGTRRRPISPLSGSRFPATVILQKGEHLLLEDVRPHTSSGFSVLQEEPTEGPAEEVARQSNIRPNPPTFV